MPQILKTESLNLDIRGYLLLTLLDWPGKVAVEIFLFGCNFKCGFCHNPELILGSRDLNPIKFDDILKDLKAREEWIDGVIFTGGEPTLYQDLPKAFRKIKELNMGTCLHTNGTNIKMLKELVCQNLVDYIAMDIKSSFDQYNKVAGNNVKLEDIKESINLLLNSNIDYEFRTTAVPGFFSKEEFYKIGKLIKGAKKFVIQQFRPLKTLDKSFKNKKPYSKKTLDCFASAIRSFVEEVEIKGI